MKPLILLIAALLFVGCSESTKADYDNFLATYGALDVYVCNESGFLENRYFDQLTWTEKRTLVTNDAYVPTRCDVKNISIQVKETVATGALYGSTN